MSKKTSAKTEWSKKAEDDDDDHNNDDDNRMVPLAFFPLEEEEEENEDDKTNEEIKDKSQLVEDEDEAKIIIHDDVIDHELCQRQLEEDKAACLAHFGSKNVTNVPPLPWKQNGNKAGLLQDLEQSELEEEEEEDNDVSKEETKEVEDVASGIIHQLRYQYGHNQSPRYYKDLYQDLF